HPKVTFIVGENGSGKSTLLEGMAIAWGFNPEGGSKNFNFQTHASHSSLHECLLLVKSTKRARGGYFLRAESFFNVASEIDKLEALASNAEASGVSDLQPISQPELHDLEPALRGVRALLSPSTGIIDSHAYLQSLLAVAESRGAQLVLHSRVEHLQRDGDAWLASGHSAGEPFTLRAQRVINAGGPFAQCLATTIEDLPVPPLHLCQGRYFSYSGRSPFSRLIYPMPEANTAGLGIHATLDLAGQLRFGPDVRWLDALEYQVDESLRTLFASAIARYFPAIDASRLQPGYAGVRAKLSGPGEPAADFLIQTPADHRLPGLVNLFGIESPGLTASLAIAERVAGAL
ncbi:MAG: FAD-dependent oxidoreductase, partial [Pseudomonas sp.]|nr:FAD-dependent oxidoreductase [Pseudomonas sp.]